MNKILNWSKTQKVNDYFPKARILGWWLKKQFLDFLFLIKLIHFQCPPWLIKAQIRWLLVNGLSYPFLRILLGGRKARKICDSLLTNINFPIVLPLSFLSKNKITLSDTEALWAYHEIYIYNIYSHEVLRKGMTVIDVGAHIGTYTILAAEKVGKNGRVIAVEPESKNYRQLLENIKLNNFQNIVPVNIALLDYEGYEKLYISPLSGTHSLLFKEDAISSIEVQTKPLDRLLEELNLKKIDIIKIDAEGAEIPILRGAEKTLKTNPNLKIFVASYHYPSEVEEVCQFLNERGFKTRVLKEGIVTTI
jgi:FkbM family methyltransferase